MKESQQKCRSFTIAFHCYSSQHYAHAVAQKKVIVTTPQSLLNAIQLPEPITSEQYTVSLAVANT